MNKVITAAIVFAASTFCFSTAQAADVKGSVDTNVKAAAVIQTNTGIANVNEAHLGSVKGKSSIGGDLRSRVLVGAVIQKNTGIANKNEVSMGSVTD